MPANRSRKARLGRTTRVPGLDPRADPAVSKADPGLARQFSITFLWEGPLPGREGRALPCSASSMQDATSKEGCGAGACAPGANSGTWSSGEAWDGGSRHNSLCIGFSCGLEGPAPEILASRGRGSLSCKTSGSAAKIPGDRGAKTAARIDREDRIRE